MKDIKYLLAYIVPALTFMALINKGLWSYATFIFAFGFVPILDTILGENNENHSEIEKETRLGQGLFDLLLYVNVPLLYGAVIYYIHQISTTQLETYEIVGLVLSMGTMMGGLGINVAHELGHKKELHKRLMSQLMLLPSLYMHFTMEHNLGHHKNVATPIDPATSRKGENVYFFWFRSITGTYANAWRLQMKLLEKQGKGFFGLANKQLIVLIIQVLFLLFLFSVGALSVLIIYTATALTSVILLETINYIEHYGLVRKKLDSGKYERVLPIHSWNSDHEMGRILLYELTRHSDHHYLANKKYQVLDSHSDAKQLPFGYPACMLLSLLPPVWYKVMDARI